MNRSLLTALVVLVIAVGWNVWTLLRMEESKQPAAIGQLRERVFSQRVVERSAGRGADASDVFTFDRHGVRVTLDLAQAWRSHAGLQRQEEASVVGTSRDLPDPNFAWLSWPVRKLQGEETIQSGRCWVIDLQNPAPENPGSAPGTVRVFIRKDDHMLMRLTAYDSEGRRTFDYSADRVRRAEGRIVVSGARARHFQPGASKGAATVGLPRMPVTRGFRPVGAPEDFGLAPGAALVWTGNIRWRRSSESVCLPACNIL